MTTPQPDTQPVFFDIVGEFSPFPTIRAMLVAGDPPDRIIAYIDRFLAAATDEAAQRAQLHAAIENVRRVHDQRAQSAAAALGGVKPEGSA